MLEVQIAARRAAIFSKFSAAFLSASTQMLGQHFNKPRSIVFIFFQFIISVLTPINAV
jgi:hypothetical protein